MAEGRSDMMCSLRTYTSCAAYLRTYTHRVDFLQFFLINCVILDNEKTTTKHDQAVMALGQMQGEKILIKKKTLQLLSNDTVTADSDNCYWILNTECHSTLLAPAPRKTRTRKTSSSVSFSDLESVDLKQRKGVKIRDNHPPPFWRTRNDFCTVWNSARWP